MFKLLLIFIKAQISSLVGGIVDYGTMIFFTEVFHIHYTISIAIGGVVGGILNFVVNRFWTFKSDGTKYNTPLKGQIIKYALTAINSIILKVSGTYMICSFYKLDYKITRLIVDLFVSIGFNYTLQKTWVFKQKKSGITPGAHNDSERN